MKSWITFTTRAQYQLGTWHKPLNCFAYLSSFPHNFFIKIVVYLKYTSPMNFIILRCASMAINPWFFAWGGKEKKNTRWLYRWYFTSTGLSETVLDCFTFISASFSVNHFTKALSLDTLKKTSPITTKPAQLSTPCTNNFISSPIQILSSEIWISFAPAWITSALAGPGRCVVGYWPGLTIRPRPAANPCNLHPTTPYSFHTTLFPIVPSSYDHVYLCF